MTINMKKNAIEMTKKFAKAAAKFGSPEYKQLQEARRDNPTFSVVTVTRKTTTKKNTYKGLTYHPLTSFSAFGCGYPCSRTVCCSHPHPDNCGSTEKPSTPLQISCLKGCVLQTVHEMARDEARHGVALKGMLERYFK